MHEGDPVFLADGRVRLRVAEVRRLVTCEVEAGGAVGSHQGLNLPGADEELPATGVEDEAWIEFAATNEVDLLAVSFVRRASDIEKVDAQLDRRDAGMPVVAKIEKPQAAERARDHRGRRRRDHGRARRPRGRAAAGGGPGHQKSLIALAARATKPVITATQMLATMIARGRPAPR